jgi:hypothetical protein
VTFLTMASTAGSVASSPATSDVQAGVLGFLVVAALGVALVFLLISMNKQFKKIGPKPEEELPSGAPPAESDAPDALPEGTIVEGTIVEGGRER